MCSKIELLVRNTWKTIDAAKFRLIFLSALTSFSLGAIACAPSNQIDTSNSNMTAANSQPTPAANTNVAQAQRAAPADNTPITLPVLDAMFADESFAGDLKSNVGLTEDQVSKLQQTARDAVLKLDETDENTSTTASVKKANEAIKQAVGDEKAKQVVDFVRQRWSGSDQEALLNRPNAVPTDTRIVVNAPAYRMDVFRDGKIERTYKVGIGYPEFPLPRGMRQAKTIVFNPAWTPPDEPWVKGKFEPGKKVEAGSKDNPLGPIKIPIGLPSLIHGGKNPAKLGTFASHGCVGLTNQGIETFAQEIAALAGGQLTPEDIKNREKDRSKTQEMNLQNPVPVELRYETIVVDDGKVHIYRDVYELDTNTEDGLRKVLSAYDVNFDQLDQNVKDQLLQALQSMAVDAKGNPVDEDDKKPSSSNPKSKSGKITTTIKGKKEIVVDVPQLAGKGYPAPVNLLG
jgi:lipoprotein-anchoring transpeptidase ErfK/SrfK